MAYSAAYFLAMISRRSTEFSQFFRSILRQSPTSTGPEIAVVLDGICGNLV